MNKILKTVLWFLLIIYGLMIIDTHTLMVHVKNVFMCREESENEFLGEFNAADAYDCSNGDEIHVFLIRPITLHNFKDGYIVVIYSRTVIDKSGKEGLGEGLSWLVWKIHKLDGEWEIVDCFQNGHP